MTSAEPTSGARMSMRTALAMIMARPMPMLAIGPTIAMRSSAWGVGGSFSMFETPPKRWSVMSRTGIP